MSRTTPPRPFDVATVECADRGTQMTLLVTVASGEWPNEQASRRPAEDPADGPSDFTEVIIGRAWDLNVFRCPVSFAHPVVALGQ